MALSIDKKLLEGIDCVAVAVSGGRDSMALLHLFCEQGFISAWDGGVSGVESKTFYVLHVEHGMRGAESLRDRDFVMGYCGDRGVPAFSVSVDVPAFSRAHGVSLETAARILRHGVFRDAVCGALAGVPACGAVATAHHGDDNAESVLMHIFRGSGLSGLRGMGAREELPDGGGLRADRDSGRTRNYCTGVRQRGERADREGAQAVPARGFLIRPLIFNSGDEIGAYVCKNRVPYAEDATNADEGYKRNFVRRKILPVIREAYPNVSEALSKLALAASEADEFIRRLTQSSVKKDQNGVFLPKSEFSEDAYINYLNIKNCLAALSVDVDIERVHYEAVGALIAGNAGARADLPHFVTVERKRDGLLFYIEPDKINRKRKI